MNNTALITENIMSTLKKSDCTSVQSAVEMTKVARNTLNGYMNALGIAKHKFPFDSKAYITNEDFRRIQNFIAENKED